MSRVWERFYTIDQYYQEVFARAKAAVQAINPNWVVDPCSIENDFKNQVVIEKAIINVLVNTSTNHLYLVV